METVFWSKVVVCILLTVGLSLAIGYGVGSGYTIDIRHFVSSRPSRLSISNFSSPSETPLAIVNGYAYTLKPFNSSKPVSMGLRIPYTLGDVRCWRQGMEYYCNGSGYILEAVGIRFEKIVSNDVTKYYYSGAASELSTTVVLYSRHFSYYVIAFIEPFTLVLLAYTIYYVFRRPLFLVFFSTLSIASILLGGFHAIANIDPKIIELSPYMLEVLWIAVVEATAIHLASIVLVVKLNKSR